MVREAEQFASEVEAQHKKIEALNSLSSFVYGQMGNQEGLGGKLSDEDKKTILATSWIDEYGSSASVEDLEEKLAEIQAIVNPITAKLYAGGVAAGKDDDEATTNHDEL
jgi:heat shock protein 5